MGKLRFAKPRPLNPKPNHKMDATKYGKACFQPLDFVPGLTFWIYGGNFLYGAVATM
ncbi:uncharacterized protein EI90DRAFT_3050177 [Cantharellus anzutake]|uniref:uncharacterized protein n=1 Tax=Cantharellus anzutake TaxID=1750568 RepID=UPI001903FD44|nr:uncharacterized protein EI90DRAFT_3050177 [Cantharellus anzutake]KAF8334762.1 hypothetical protein EI90DRAFT_3050177 [Cantharellus anzutake]